MPDSTADLPLSDDLDGLGLGAGPSKSYHATSATQLVIEAAHRQDLRNEGGVPGRGFLEDDDVLSGAEIEHGEDEIPSGPPTGRPDYSLLTPPDTLGTSPAQQPIQQALPQQPPQSRPRTYISNTPSARFQQRQTTLSETQSFGTAHSQQQPPPSSLPGQLSTSRSSTPIQASSNVSHNHQDSDITAPPATILVVNSVVTDKQKASDLTTTHETCYLFYDTFEEEALKEAAAETNKPQEIFELRKCDALLFLGQGKGKGIPLSWRNGNEFCQKMVIVEDQQSRLGPLAQMQLRITTYVVTKAAFAAQLQTGQPPAKKRRTVTEHQLEHMGERINDDERAGSYAGTLFTKWKCDDQGCAVISFNPPGCCWKQNGCHYYVNGNQLKVWSKSIANRESGFSAPPYHLAKQIEAPGPSRRKNESPAAYRTRVNRNIQAVAGAPPQLAQGNQQGTQQGSGQGSHVVNVVLSSDNISHLLQGNQQPTNRSSPPTGDTDPDQRVREFFEWKAEQAPNRRERYMQIADQFVDRLYELQGVKHYYRNHRDNHIGVPEGLLLSLDNDVRRFERERPPMVGRLRDSPRRTQSGSSTESEAGYEIGPETGLSQRVLDTQGQL